MNAASVPNRVLPDGCSDIIIGVGDVSGAVAVGTMRTAAIHELTGRVDMLGVRFHPGCGLPFIGVPLSEITDQRVPLDEIWGRDALQLADPAIAPLQRALTRRLHRWMSNASADEPLATRAIVLLRQSRGGARVRDVAAALGVGERRLERAFDRSVGLSPKVFARVMRLRRAVNRIIRPTRGGTPRSWTSIAFDAGYADQPHLIREFRALTGLTPDRYVAERTGVGFVQYDDPVSA